MLLIAADTLPRSLLSYIAFRIAFQDTLERVALAEQVGDRADGFGYLTEVPFLQAVPPQVQLDLLAQTWGRHMATDPFAADLVDESVIYAACETAARLVEEQPIAVAWWLTGGPIQAPVPPGPLLAEGLRALHINLPSEGDFLLISQFEDLPPKEADRVKWKFGIDPARLECLFEVLARWRTSAEFVERLEGLFGLREIARIRSILHLE
ncbi:MAG: hypothetical protein WD069_08585 [Planctomycetales bacterium]